MNFCATKNEGEFCEKLKAHLIFNIERSLNEWMNGYLFISSEMEMVSIYIYIYKYVGLWI